VEEFIKEFKLQIVLYKVPGDHYFGSNEDGLGDLMLKLVE
jgi:hypothetical protein